MTTHEDLRRQAGVLWDAIDELELAQEEVSKKRIAVHEASTRFTELRQQAPEEERIKYNKQRKLADPIA